MVENDLENSDLQQVSPRLRFDWLLPLLARPRRTLKEICAQEKAVWLVPLLLLSLLAVVHVLASGPARQMGAQIASSAPIDTRYYTDEQRLQIEQAVQAGQSPLMIYLLPAVGSLAGLWVGWFLLGSFLHLALTLSGSRSSNTTALNLAAWASLPTALRYLVQSIAMLVSRRLLVSPGLSGFVTAGGGGGQAFLRALLERVDLYLFWQVALLLIGSVLISGLTRKKAWPVALVAVLLWLSVRALPSFISAQLGSLSGAGMFF